MDWKIAPKVFRVTGEWGAHLLFFGWAVLPIDMAIEFDESHWPIVICRAVGHSTDEDIEIYTRTLGTYLLRRKRHVLIVDARSGQSLNSRHRRFVAEWNRENARVLSQYRAALFLVTPSTLLRGMITAVYWIFPPPFPYKTVESMGQATSQAEECLTRNARPEPAH